MSNKNETKLCKKCREEIKKGAKKCTKCGASQGMPTFIKIVIIIIVIFVCVVGCMSSCANSVSDAVDKVDKEMKDEYRDINNKKSFKVGETFQNKHFKVTVTDVDLDYKSSSEYDKPGEGRKYVKVNITAENIGEDSSDISSFYFTLYADGTKADDSVIVLEADNTDFGGTISSGKTTKGPIYYEVPKEAKKLVLEYEPNVLDDKYQVEWKLN